MKSRYVVAAGLSTAGLVDAAYLSYERLRPGTLVCPVTGEGCSAVASSWFAAPFGLPIAYVGFIGYAVLVVLAVLAHIGTDVFGIKSVPMLRKLVAATVVTAVVLFGIQSLVIGAFCFWCLVSTLIDFVLFAVVYTGEKVAPKPTPRKRQRGRAPKQHTSLWPVWMALTLAVPVFIALALPARTSSATVGTNGVDITYPTKGADTALVTVVVYSDYQCPACAAFATQFEPQFDALYVGTGKVRVEFRDFPLGQHANALKAAMTARIAGTHGKYWQMHDLLFERQSQWNEARNPDALFSGYAAQLGIDEAAFRAALQRGDFRDVVTASAAEAYASGITGTPTIIVDGVLVSSWSDIPAAVDAALAARTTTR